MYTVEGSEGRRSERTTVSYVEGKAVKAVGLSGQQQMEYLLCTVQ